MFCDREDAARQLAACLRDYEGKHPLVLGILAVGRSPGRCWPTNLAQNWMSCCRAGWRS